MKLVSRNITTVISLLLLFASLVFLTLNRHNKAEVFTYHSEIWADKAGYYIYLPAFFIYDFQAEKLPVEIEAKTGKGFLAQQGKIKTKYSYGVALMQLPFFIGSHILAKISSHSPDGFSLIYQKAIDVAAVVYSFCSLILLFNFLINYVKIRTAFLSILCIYLGTNILYYSVIDTGMSHIYSFFLFAAFLNLSRDIFEPKKKITSAILFGLVSGLIVAVRPMNIIFLPCYFIVTNVQLRDFKLYLNRFIIAFIAGLFVLIPQFIYWKYAYGHYLVYSYETESFINKYNPKLLNLWFSTNNGLFMFNPMVILVVIGVIGIWKLRLKLSLLMAGYFLLLSYIFASWHDWTYGCSYGCRPYVEYYALFSLPFGIFMDKLSNHRYRILLYSLLFIFIVYNLKLIFSYDGCWYGGNWDYTELVKLLLAPTK